MADPFLPTPKPSDDDSELDSELNADIARDLEADRSDAEEDAATHDSEWSDRDPAFRTPAAGDRLTAAELEDDIDEDA